MTATANGKKGSTSTLVAKKLMDAFSIVCEDLVAQVIKAYGLIMSQTLPVLKSIDQCYAFLDI
jgi:hypothetical protein